jgi:DNA-binding NarL/FixJ family response regulator
MGKINILIADDHNILRQGLIDSLRIYNDIVVVGEAENGMDLIEKYEKRRPDVVLTDIEMPGLNGLDAAAEILKKHPNAKVLFLSMYFAEDYIYKVDLIGGKGLLSKEIFKDELVSAIRTVYTGGTYYFGMSEEELQKVKLRSNEIRKGNRKSETVLTPREHEILIELADGISSEEIAKRLNVGKRTVDTYRSAIMSKLEIESLPKLVVYAVQYREGKRNLKK